MEIDNKIKSLICKQYKTNSYVLWLGGIFLIVCFWVFFPLSAQRLDSDMFKNVLSVVAFLVVFFSFIIRPLIDFFSVRKALVEVDETDSMLIGNTVNGNQITLVSKSPELHARSFYSIEYRCFMYFSEDGNKYYYPVERIMN